MLARLLLLFTVVPLLELVLLLWIAEHTGWKFTLGLVIFTGVLGAWLARQQGLRCWQRFQQQLAQGELPADSLLDGLMILIAGAVLVTPGVLTDLVGFALLIPPVRKLARQHLARRIRPHVVVGPMPGTAGRGTEQDDVIDVEHRVPGESGTEQE